MQSDRIIYVLCYDDITEQRAREDFSKYSWARIYRIKNQSHLFEGVMYHSELMELYDEWKDKTFVGTISYKLKERTKWFPTVSFENIIHKIERASELEYDVVGLVEQFSGANMFPEGDRYPLLETIFKDICNTCHIPMSKVYKFGLRKNYNIYTSPFIFFNHWMARPKWMLEYIHYFISSWLPAVESHPLIWENSGYPGMSSDKLLNLTKRVDYYTYHPFINERFTTLFFYHRNARILF